MIIRACFAARGRICLLRKPSTEPRRETEACFDFRSISKNILFWLNERKQRRRRCLRLRRSHHRVARPSGHAPVGRNKNFKRDTSFYRRRPGLENVPQVVIKWGKRAWGEKVKRKVICTAKTGMRIIKCWIKKQKGNMMFICVGGARVWGGENW